MRRLLGRAGRRKEALAIASECELFERNHWRLTELPSLAFNKGFNLYMLGENAESIAFFAQAYYGASMFSKYGQGDIQRIAQDAAQKLLGITFD